MKTAKILPLLWIVGLLALPCAAGAEPKAYLQGLDTVRVDISVSQVLVDAGVPGAQLRTQTELQLRQAGIKVDPASTGASLLVEITGCRAPGTNSYACYVHVSVNDSVQVMRNGKGIVTQVWGPDLWVFYLPNGVATTVVETTKARMDVFLNDWLQANPR